MIKPTKETSIAFLSDLAIRLQQPLRGICFHVLQNQQFFVSPGGSKHHHDYVGGLALHTAEVAYFALNLSGVRLESNRFVWASTLIDVDILLTAAIWHDFLKIAEYEIAQPADLTGKVTIKDRPFRFHIGHVVGSVLAFKEECEKWGVDTSQVDKITHAMLAHHGRREWGSPVEPATPEAFILHAADMLSSRGYEG